MSGKVYTGLDAVPDFHQPTSGGEAEGRAGRAGAAGVPRPPHSSLARVLRPLAAALFERRPQGIHAPSSRKNAPRLVLYFLSPVAAFPHRPVCPLVCPVFHPPVFPAVRPSICVSYPESVQPASSQNSFPAYSFPNLEI